MNQCVMLKRLARPFYHRMYRLAVRVWCHCQDRLRRDSSLPPAMLRFRVIETPSVRQFIDIGRGCAEILTNLVLSLRGIKPGDKILDFGCGCGRTLRWLMQSHPEAEFSGCDVDGEAINCTYRNISSPGAFQVNSASPPLNYESSYL